MTIQFEDILSALCSEVTLSHATETQKIYLLHDAKEARLARDVLATYGFDVKVYDEDDASKFYITMPALDPALVEQKLSAVLTYAVSLKEIKESLDALCDDPTAQAPDYTIMLANIPSTGKQIVVHFASPPPNASVSAAPAAVAKKQAKIKPKKRKHQPAVAISKSFSSAPEVARASYRTSSNKDMSELEHTGKILYNYIGGYLFTSIYAVFVMVVILMALFTLFTFSKSFLCPDFATAKKNTAWYCQKNE